MSIDNDLQPVASITEGDRALSLFTDRYSFTRLLAERLNDPPKKEILFFHGAGGNGKSLLLKHLRTRICKGLTAEQWQRAKVKPDDRLAEVLEGLAATQYLPVPTALLDFAPGSNRRDSDPFYGLVRIREELAASTAGTPYRLKFPLHTYGCFLYLHKTNRLSEVDKLFPFEEAGLIKDFVGLFQSVPTGVGFGLSALKLVDKYSGQRLTHYKRRFGLDEAAVNRLREMDAESELILELPRLLAQDLNVAMERTDAPSRVVLFFDTHEAFYGEARSHSKNFFRDGWLRRLLRKLDTEAGIVVVVAGRDKPRWAEADKYEQHTQIPADYVCLKSVEDLAESDAEIFLQRAGVTDVALRESLIRYASVEAGRVHPLHLGLCADVALEAAAKGVTLVPGDFSRVAAFQEKSAYLVEQLLKYVDEGLRDAIRALSACRAFDFEIYRLLGEKLSFAVDRATFRRLVGFSFVRQVAQRGDKWFRIHDLLRRLGNEPVVVQAHEVLAAHYQEQRQIEWIYHVNRLDWSQGVDLWVGVFNEELQVSRYELCRALLELRRELTIQTPFKLGLVSDAEGQYFQNLALYDAALQKFREAVAAYSKELETDPENSTILNNKGNSLQRLADLQATLSDYSQARQTYIDSIAAFDAVLNPPSRSLTALNNKGNSLAKLAGLQTTLSQHEFALENYEASIATFDTVLHLSLGNLMVLNNKGKTLQSLANLQAVLSQHQIAQENYKASIIAFDTVLEHMSNNLIVLNNKGLSLQNLADSQVALSHYQLALESYEASITTFNIALECAPGNVGAMSNKGLSLRSLADLQATLSQHQSALGSYEASIAIFDTALERAPDNIGAINNKGLLLRSLADLQATLSQHQSALGSYEASIATFDTALERAPNSVQVINNKGNSLQSLADLQIVLSQQQIAIESYKASIAIYGIAVEYAPDDVTTISNRGASLAKLADLHATLSEHQLAKESYESSIAAFDAALSHAPDYVDALNNKGLTLAKLADLHATLSEHQLAKESYESSIAVFDAALTHAPKKVMLLDNKGTSLAKLADLQSSLSEHQQAQQTYATSITAFDAILKHSPNHVGVLNNKGTSLRGLANSFIQREQIKQAVDCLGTALALWGRSLQIAPGNTRLQEHRDHLVSYLQSWLDDTQTAITDQAAVLKQTPDDLEALTTQGSSLTLLASLQSILSQPDAAIESYRSAMTIYETARAIAPNNWQHHYSAGEIYRQLASLTHSTQPAQSDAYTQQALAAWNRAVELSPDSAELKEHRDWLLSELQNNESA